MGLAYSAKDGTRNQIRLWSTRCSLLYYPP